MNPVIGEAIAITIVITCVCFFLSFVVELVRAAIEDAKSAGELRIFRELKQIEDLYRELDGR